MLPATDLFVCVIIGDFEWNIVGIEEIGAFTFLCLGGFALCLGSLSGWLGETRRFEFLNAFYGAGGDALTFGLEALNGNKFFRIDFDGVAVGIGAAERHADARIRHIGQDFQLRFGIVAGETPVATTAGRLEQEAFHIEIPILVSIIEHGGPRL